MKTINAFIISGGEQKSSLNYYKKIIENSDILIAVDKGIKIFQQINIEPDYLIGDLDSASSESIEWAESNDVKIIKYPPEKDFTDIDLAFKFALEKGTDKIFVSAFLGERLDHILSALFLLAKYDNIDIIFDEEFIEVSKISKNFSKEVSPGETWSILSLTEKSYDITLKGFKYPLENGILYFNNPIGISNITENTKVEITYSKGILIYIRWKTKNIK